MKLLHLADLHIGIHVNGFPMLEDQQHILNQILGYLEEEKVDALLVAGDVYDKQSPPAEAVRVLDAFLTGAVALGVTVILISGNHDSPERLAFGGSILGAGGVHIHGVYDGTIPTVTLEDEHGPVCFHLLPYLRPSMVRRFWPEEDIRTHHDGVRAALAHHDVDEDMRNVLLAHQFVTAGSWEPERSDSETLAVGGIDRVDAALFTAFDYVALGHIHRPQMAGRETMRYAGSPLKYSFSEWRQDKSAVLVQLGEKGEVALQTLPLRPLRDLRKIAGPLEELLREEVAALGNREDYLHVTLTDEEEHLDAMARVRRVYPNVMQLSFDNRRARAELEMEQDWTVEESLPEELFADFYLQRNGSELSEGQRRVLLEELGEVVVL